METALVVVGILVMVVFLSGCVDRAEKNQKPKNNFEKIQGMSQEELAKFLNDELACPPISEGSKNCGQDCWLCWEKYLLEEVKEDEER